MANTLGIDFGTTNSSASYTLNGNPEAIRFVGQDYKMPSLVTFFGGQTCVGFSAQDRLSGLPYMAENEQRDFYRSTVLSIKSNLDAGNIAGHTPLEIVTLIISHIKQEAEKACSPIKFENLVLTHPIEFEERKKNLLKEAARGAGFSQVELLPEPVSAAMGYLKNDDTVRGVIVYDFGGGTFDVAYVTKQDERFVVPFPGRGDSKCGGDDIDRALYSLVARKASAAIGPEYVNTMDMSLIFNCRRWKESLSISDNIPIWIASKKDISRKTNFTLTRSEFESAIAPIIDKTINLTVEIFNEVEKNRLPLDCILLIGGSSNIPMIKRRLEEAIPGVGIRTTGNSDIAVALGASFHAKTPVNLNSEEEWCYCMYDGKQILKSYNFCIFCGKPNFYKTGKF